jgi:DNA-binding response OmpR family regulator
VDVFATNSAPDPPSAGSILIIEDDPKFAKALQLLFTAEGYEVRQAYNGAQGLNLLHTAPDAVILDLLLPDLPGREVCRKMKQANPEIPVIILTTISDIVDTVRLSEMGADDHLTKPFTPRELLARVQATMRRWNRAVTKGKVTFGEIFLDFASMRSTKNGNPVTLTAFEFKLLKFFVNNPERVITREELFNAVWGGVSLPVKRKVDNKILKLRQKLENDPAAPVHFCTVHGAGYQFVPEKRPR